MFDIHKVSDKYKILYLKEGVKNKFLTLLLIGLDDQYMNTDLETLNNSSNYYKKNLNQKIKSAFGENFSVKSNGHLDALSEMCGVNFIIKNLTSNENKYASKIYGKTLYFVNKGNEYGLVLKSNKKSLKAELTDGTLSAFEKLNLEGGVGKDVYLMEGGPDHNPRQKDIQQALSSPRASQQPATPPRATQPPSSPAHSETSLTSVAETIYKRQRNSNASQIAQPTSYGSQINIISPQKRRRNVTYETKNLQEEWRNLCLDNCLVNEASTYYTDTILTEMNAKIEKDINNWDKIAKDFEYQDNIFGCITDMIEYKIKKKEILDSLQDFEGSDIKREFNQRFKKDVWYEKFKKFEKLENIKIELSKDIISEFNTVIGTQDIPQQLKDNVKFNVKMNLLNLSYSSNKGDWDIISQNDEEWIDDDGLRARINWSRERKNGLGKDNLSERNVSMIDQGAGSLEGGTLFELNPLNQGNISDTTSNFYYKSIIDKYSIIDLLERGIDSQHDFGSQIKDNNTTTLNAKRELFEAFNPDKIDEGFSYTDYNKFIISLAVLVYDSFNKVIIKDIKNSNNYQIKSGLSIPFEPRLTKRVQIDQNHNPFAHKGWEKNSKLYYIAGNTEQYNPSNQMDVNIGYTGVNLFDRVKANSKKIIIFQDSQGSSDVIFSFFNNIDMRPGSFYQSFDNYIRTLKTAAQKKAFITKLNKVKADLGFVVNLTNFDNNDMKESLFNILKAKELQNFNTGLISTGDKSWFMKTPATALDGAGSSYLVKSEFQKNLDEINEECGLTSNVNRLMPEEIWRWNLGFNSNALLNFTKFNVYYDGIPEYKGTPNDPNLQSLHRLICMNTSTNPNTKINILDETYQGHFGKICNSNSRVKVPPSIPKNPFGLEKIHDIKFEVVLGEYKDLKDGVYEVQLWPVLLMSHYVIDPNSNNIQITNSKYDMVLRSVSLQNLTVIDNISNVLNIVYAKSNVGLNTELNNGVKSKNIDIGYQIIYNNIVDWAKNSVIKVNGKDSKWKYSHINHVFIRILYTLKMIGDHGQVKFIKALKENVKDFNKHFEVLFTTGDSLASLYACLHNVTNTSTVVTDFPSESYCVSKPKGMVYYPS